MKSIGFVMMACFIALAPGGYVGAQVAGSTRLGVAVEEMKVHRPEQSGAVALLGRPPHTVESG